MIGISHGKEEINPVASLLMERIGVLPAVLLVKLVSVTIVLSVATRLPLLLPVGCVAVTGAILWNLAQLAS